MDNLPFRLSSMNEFIVSFFLDFHKKEENKFIVVVQAISFRRVYNCTVMSSMFFGKWKALTKNGFVRTLSLLHTKGGVWE